MLAHFARGTGAKPQFQILTEEVVEGKKKGVA